MGKLLDCPSLPSWEGIPDHGNLVIVVAPNVSNDLTEIIDSPAAPPVQSHTLPNLPELIQTPGGKLLDLPGRDRLAVIRFNLWRPHNGSRPRIPVAQADDKRSAVVDSDCCAAAITPKSAQVGPGAVASHPGVGSCVPIIARDASHDHAITGYSPTLTVPVVIAADTGFEPFAGVWTKERYPDDPDITIDIAPTHGYSRVVTLHKEAQVPKGYGERSEPGSLGR